jgi:ComF family protein
MSASAPSNNLMRAMRDLFFPPTCLSCGGLCESATLKHVCARCEPLIFRVRKPHCITCGHPYFGAVAGERICPHCEGLRPQYGRAKTVTLFKGPSRELILTLKYRHGLHALEDIRTIIAENTEVLAFLRGAVLVPIPLHPRKERERGYNQSTLVAEAFSAASRPSVLPIANLLRRTIDGASQIAFDRRTRQRRMKNAFAARNTAAITPDQRYVLVDDVFTTGSTLNAAARALRSAGAMSLDVVTFAHG